MPPQTQQTIRKALSIIAKVPFTRVVFLTGSMAEGRANEKSDIDLFIQVKEGRIWSTRFFVTLLIHIAGIRRTDNDIPGKVCLNWFATFNAPAKQKGRVYKVLWKDFERHPRLKGQSLLQHGDLIPDLVSPPANQARMTTKLFFEKLLSGFLGNAVEKILKKYQIARILHDPRTHEPGSQVRYSDQELGFHPNRKIVKNR